MLQQSTLSSSEQNRQQHVDRIRQITQAGKSIFILVLGGTAFALNWIFRQQQQQPQCSTLHYISAGWILAATVNLASAIAATLLLVHRQQQFHTLLETIRHAICVAMLLVSSLHHHNSAADAASPPLCNSPIFLNAFDKFMYATHWIGLLSTTMSVVLSPKQSAAYKSEVAPNKSHP
jgi:hypothetical protein